MPRSRRGRPRDPTIDTRVLQVYRDLLVERGLQATTIQAIAERSGLHAPAIYRRWSTRSEIIEQAVFSGFAQIVVRPTGDLRRDLRRFVRAYLAVFDSPAARAAMPGLLAAEPASVDPAVDPDDVFDCSWAP